MWSELISSTDCNFSSTLTPILAKSRAPTRLRTSYLLCAPTIATSLNKHWIPSFVPSTSLCATFYKEPPWSFLQCCSQQWTIPIIAGLQVYGRWWVRRLFHSDLSHTSLVPSVTKTALNEGEIAHHQAAGTSRYTTRIQKSLMALMSLGLFNVTTCK